MRASAPSSRKSCIGIITVEATDIMAVRTSCPATVFSSNSRPKYAIKVFLLAFGGVVLKPPLYRVVVMRAGVNDAVLHMIVGNVRVCGRAASKSKQQDLHSGEFEFAHDFPDLRSDDTEVFGNYWNRWKAPQQHMEELPGWSFHPFSVDGGFFRRRHFPVGYEPPEVIEPNHVETFQIVLYTADPPLIEGFLELIPGINRIAPQLPGVTEIIGRHSRDESRPFVTVELKVLTICPNV